jgi:hypothetical protein
VHTHAEHQQHDANLGKLFRQVHVADKPRGERPNDDAGQQVANQRH